LSKCRHGLVSIQTHDGTIVATRRLPEKVVGLLLSDSALELIVVAKDWCKTCRVGYQDSQPAEVLTHQPLGRCTSRWEVANSLFGWPCVPRYQSLRIEYLSIPNILDHEEAETTLGSFSRSLFSGEEAVCARFAQVNDLIVFNWGIVRPSKVLPYPIGLRNTCEIFDFATGNRALWPFVMVVVDNDGVLVLMLCGAHRESPSRKETYRNVRE